MIHFAVAFVTENVVRFAIIQQDGLFEMVIILIRMYKTTKTLTNNYLIDYQKNVIRFSNV